MKVRLPGRYEGEDSQVQTIHPPVSIALTFSDLSPREQVTSAVSLSAVPESKDTTEFTGALPRARV